MLLLYNFQKIRKKTLAQESPFGVTVWWPAISTKKRLQHRLLPMNCAISLRTPIL